MCFVLLYGMYPFEAPRQSMTANRGEAFMKRSQALLLGVALIAAVGAVSAQVAVGAHSQPIRVDISAQPLGDALNAFAKQTRMQVVLYSQVGKGIVAPH